MTNASSANDNSADRTRRHNPTIVVTLSIVDVQLRRTDPGATISWEELFASDGGTAIPDRTSANPESLDVSAWAAGATGEASREGPEPSAGMRAQPNGVPAPQPADGSQHGGIYTVGMADRIAAELRALPAIDRPRRGLGKQGVVRLLKQQISIVQRRGYTLEEIAAQLTALGFGITGPTLKSYLRGAKRRSRKRAVRRPLPLVLRDGVS